uniref:Uncharacterized protein n=1 Tax=Populus trichocarpa TaxID=3694 RepID=A0A3N7FJ98_POPTR
MEKHVKLEIYHFFLPDDSTSYLKFFTFSPLVTA